MSTTIVDANGNATVLSGEGEAIISYASVEEPPAVTAARRSDFEVFFDGVDITGSVKKYFLSLSFTDNEEGETDDVQIKLHDRDGIWREKWLNAAIDAAAGRNDETVIKQYRVTAAGGVAMRSSADATSKSLGSIAYGTIIDVKDIKDGWASFKHTVTETVKKNKQTTTKTSEKTVYVEEKHLKPIYKEKDDTSTASETVTVTSNASSSDWNIGDEVTASGRPQYSSYGSGTSGNAVTNYKGTITHLNLKDGVPYPIHVGSLGWFSKDQVSKGTGAATVATSSATTEDAVGKGLKIQAAIIRHNWTGKGEIERLDCGQFELDNVTVSGPPEVITIKGTSLPYSSTVRQTKKSRSWESYSLSGIVNEIAETNGMAAMCLFSKDISYSRMEQFRISDIAFLQKLCQDVGYSLKVTNNIIVVFDQVAYESKPIIRTIKHGKEGGYTSYKLQTGKNDTFTSCRVSYVDPDGKHITATAYIDDYDADSEDNQCLDIWQKVESVAEAQELAKKHLRLHNKYEFTAQYTFPGDPSLLAGCTVGLEGWGAFDNKYIIKQAKHTVDNSGYKTQIDLRRALLSKEEEAAAETTETAVTAAQNIDEVARAVIRGEWGNGNERRRRLTEAGYDYDAVQKRVNELLG